LFSARSREELLFFDELSKLATSGNGFSLIVTLTREADAHPFRAGRIDAEFIDGVVKAAKMPVHQVLICGSNPFVETAAEGTITAGIDPAIIKTERYGAADVHAEARIRLEEDWDETLRTGPATIGKCDIKDDGDATISSTFAIETGAGTGL
jgi:ferredoxin-NADP reductase